MQNERVFTLFQQSIETRMQVGEALVAPITQAGEIVSKAILDEKKIFACGNGASFSLAQIFCSCLTDRFEQERPSLPAILLGGNAASYTAIAACSSFDEVFSNPLQALGQSGDVLVVVSTSGNPENLINAVKVAKGRGMHIILLSGRDGGQLASLLDEHDIEIRVELHARSRIHEIHLLSLFCLCDLLDSNIFGLHSNLST